VKRAYAPSVLEFLFGFKKYQKYKSFRGLKSLEVFKNHQSDEFFQSEYSQTPFLYWRKGWGWRL